jgi:large subunit ribosomal protein L9
LTPLYEVLDDSIGMKLLVFFILALVFLSITALRLPKTITSAYRRLREQPSSSSSSSSSLHRLFNQKVSQSTDKIRVKLLQDTPQGKKNEIVMVSNALWNNVILPKKLGVRISDQELAVMQQQAADQAAKELEFSKEFIKKLTAAGAIAAISKKVGSNGQLFGSVNHKAIVEQVKKCVAGYDEVVDNKAFHVTGVYEYAADGSVLKENLTEIRKAGKYRIRVKVHPKIEEVDFDLIVGAENK